MFRIWIHTLCRHSDSDDELKYFTKTDRDVLVPVEIPVQLDLALHRPAFHYNLNSWFDNMSYLVAGNAVDGNRDGVPDEGSISASGFYSNPWWSVDFGQLTFVQTVIIFSESCSNFCGEYTRKLVDLRNLIV